MGCTGEKATEESAGSEYRRHSSWQWVVVLLFVLLTCCRLPAAAADTLSPPAKMTISDVRMQFEDELFDMAYTVHVAKNQYDEALSVAEDAIRKRPGNIDWRRRAALTAERAGRPEKALGHLTWLAEQGDGTARQTALRLSRSMNELPVRRSLLEGMLTAGADNTELLKEYLKVSEEVGATGEAYDLLANRISNVNRELQLQELARLAEQLGRPFEALNALDKLALLRPLTPQENNRRTRLQFGTGDLDRDWQTSFGTESPREPLVDGVTSADPTPPPVVSDEPRRSYVWTQRTPRTEHRRYAMIDPPAVGALLRYQMNQDERTVKGVKTVDTSHTVTERVDLSSKGYLYHPALLQFRLKFSPEFLQTTQSTTETVGNRGVTGNSFSPNYQVNATILGQKPYSLTAFSQHLEAQSWATYTGVTRTVSDAYGADLSLKHRLLPTTLGFSSSRSEQSGNYASSTDWQEFHLFSNHSVTRSESSLASTYSINRQVTDTVSTEITTFSNRLSNQYKMTEDGRIRLSSNLQFMYQNANALKTDSLFINEQLSWQHHKNLQSQYQYAFRQINSQGTQNISNALDARLTHKLYENLTSTAGLAGNLNDTGDSSEKTATGVFSTAYQRKLGSWGKLNLAAGITPRYSTRTGSSATMQVSNEGHSLNSATETFLSQPDIDLGSIVVTNSGGTLIYVENIDYRLDLVGRTTRISRLSMGAIGDGQLVMVSYRYTRSAGYDDLLLTQSYSAGMELFNALTLSYSYSKADQTLLAGPVPDRLNNSEVHLAVIRLDEGWGDTGFTYEDAKDTSDLSYTRWEASQGLKLRYGSWFQSMLRGYYGQTRYRITTDQKTSYGGTFSLNWSPLNWIRLNLEGFLDRIDGTQQKTLNVGSRAGLEANYRLWTARLGYKYVGQDDRMSDYKRTVQMLQFELTRAVW